MTFSRCSTHDISIDQRQTGLNPSPDDRGALILRDSFWRKTPSVKRLVLRVIPDPTTRYAALKNGEIDVTYWMTASLGEDLRRTPGLTLRPVVSSVMQWVAF
jgi:ABC-type transport system substrate-binding protein